VLRQQTVRLLVMKSILLGIFIFMSAGAAHAVLLFNYSQLILKDLDQMNRLVQQKIVESQTMTSGDPLQPLREGLQAVYSRPNEDLMIEKVISPLKNALDEQEAYEQTIRDLVSEGISQLRNPKQLSGVVQVTYLVFLENILSEFNPLKDRAFEKSIIEQIRDANIVVSDSARSERTLRTMKQNPSPSELAERLIPSAKPEKKPWWKFWG
jgi:hypothetical protein